MCKLVQGQTTGAPKEEVPSSKSEGVLTLTEPLTPHCQDHLGNRWQHHHPPWNKWPARVAEAIIKVAQTVHRELFGYQHRPHITATGWLHLGPDPQYKQSTKQDQHQPWHHTQHSDMWTAIDKPSRSYYKSPRHQSSDNWRVTQQSPTHRRRTAWHGSIHASWEAAYLHAGSSWPLRHQRGETTAANFVFFFLLNHYWIHIWT